MDKTLKPSRNLTGAFDLPRRLLLLSLALLLMCVPSSAADTPLTQKVGDRLWIPETTIKLAPSASAVALSDKCLYFALTGGLGEYDFGNKSFSLYYLGNDEIAGDITSLALVKDTLWVATRGGIHLFSTEKKSFGRMLTTHNSPLGSDNNISLTFDAAAQELYVMSFEHIQKYDLKSGRWEDLNYLYENLKIGEPASNPFCLLDGNNVWIASGAHESSRGALFRYNKRDRVWCAYRDELTGRKNTKRIDIDDMVLMANALYVLIDDKVARYDIEDDRWEQFSLDSTGPMRNEIVSHYPGFQGHFTRDTGCLLSYIAGIGGINLRNFRELYFGTSHAIGLNPESFSIFRGAMPNVPVRYVQMPLEIEKPLGCDGISRVLLLTNRGLEILDASSKTLQGVKKSGYFTDKGDFYDYQTVWKEGTVLLLFRKMPDPEDGKAPQFARIYLIDVKTGELTQATPGGTRWIEEIFLYKNTIYAATDKSLMKWKNNTWEVTKEKVQWIPPAAHPPSRTQVYTLKGGKKVECGPRGILLY